jgi:ABC-type lipoprotein release transport system permease subunit
MASRWFPSIVLLGYSLRWMRSEWGRALFTVVGVALGVSVFVATLVAQTSMDQSFRSAVEGFAGAGWWEITAEEQGLKGQVLFSEQIVGDLYSVNDYWPIIPELSVPLSVSCTASESEAAAVKTMRQKVLLRGVDVLSMPLYYQQSKGLSWSLSQLTSLLEEPSAVVADLAQAECVSYVTETGESLTNIAQHQGAAGSEFPVLLADIARVQEKHDLVGRLSRVLIKPSGASEQDQLIQIAKKHGLSATPLTERVTRFQDITQAFRVNILFLSACSLIVATYLLHSLLSFWCLRRRDDGRLLRSIGVTPSQMYWMVVLEAMAMALCGTALGLAGGWLVGGVLLGAVTETVSILYTRVPLGAPVLTLTNLLPVIGAGLLVGFVSSHGQAKDLAKEVVQSLKGDGLGFSTRVRWVRQLFFAAVFFVGAWLGARFVLNFADAHNLSELWIGLGVPLSYLAGVLLLVSPYTLAI